MINYLSQVAERVHFLTGWLCVIVFLALISFLDDKANTPKIFVIFLIVLGSWIFIPGGN